MSQLPLSLGGFHSSATLKPQMSTIFRDSGGPGRSAQWQKQQTSVCRHFLPVQDVLPESPTYNLQSDTRRVLHVLDLHLQVVHPGVFSLSLADEEDGVHVAVPHAGKRAAQRLALFAPCHFGPWFTLFGNVAL